MGTKVRVDQSIDDIDEWGDQFEEQEESPRAKTRYNSKRRRQIEDLMEERRLASQLRDSYDELDELY